MKRKIWYWQNLNETSNDLKEVELGMGNVASQNHILTTMDNSLVIKKFSINDSGIYGCLNIKEQNDNDEFYYRLERIKNF